MMRIPAGFTSMRVSFVRNVSRPITHRDLRARGEKVMSRGKKKHLRRKLKKKTYSPGNKWKLLRLYADTEAVEAKRRRRRRGGGGLLVRVS